MCARIDVPVRVTESSRTRASPSRMMLMPDAGLGHLADDGDGADLPQILRAGILALVVLQDEQDQTVAAQGAVDGLDRHAARHRQRLQRQRKRDGAPEREDGEFGWKRWGRRVGHSLGRAPVYQRSASSTGRLGWVGGRPSGPFDVRYEAWTSVSSSPRSPRIARRPISARSAAAPTSTRSGGSGGPRRLSRRSGSDERARAMFNKVKDYLVRVDEHVTCKTCRKRFEIPVAPQHRVPRGARRFAEGRLRRVGSVSVGS